MSHVAFQRLRRLALGLCLAAVVLGGRWALINRDAMDLPEWDQLDAEGLNLIKPWLNHALSIRTLITPHNEHRVVLTKLVALGLAAADGQWDQRLEAVANAVLPALLALALFLLVARQLRSLDLLCWFACLALALASPLSWQNATHGFHSQQFFLLLLSYGAIRLLPFAEPYRARWWAGALCTFAALGSMASGMAAAGIVGALLLIQVACGQRKGTAALPAWVVCGITVAIGVVSQVQVPGHRGMMAHSVSDFVFTFLRAAGWPVFDVWPVVSLAIWLPWIVTVVGMLLRPRREGRELDHVLLGLGGWVLLQFVAAAYVRGGGGGDPPRRYLDTTIFGILVNGLCLCRWSGASGDWRRPWRHALGTAALIWGVGLVCGGGWNWKRSASEELARDEGYHFYCLANVRHYYATGDADYLRHSEIPYPGWDNCKARLDEPTLKRMMPAGVRLALPVAARRASGFVRVDDRHPEHRVPTTLPLTGLSASTPLLDNAVWWGSAGRSAGRATGAPARFVSQPIKPTLRGWLMFYVADSPAGAGPSLELRDPGTQRVLAAASTSHAPADSWHAVYLRTPHVPFVITADAPAGAGWLAFSEPVDTGFWSYVAMRAAHHGLLVAELGAGAGLVLWALGPFDWRHSP